jgi:hypothetical protein
LLSADALKRQLRIASRVDTRDDDQQTWLQAVEDLEWKPAHETAASAAVEDLARFGEGEQRDKDRIDGMNKLCAETGTLRFVPFESGGDVLFRVIKKPDSASRLSRQGAP